MVSMGLKREEGRGKRGEGRGKSPKIDAIGDC